MRQREAEGSQSGQTANLAEGPTRNQESAADKRRTYIERPTPSPPPLSKMKPHLETHVKERTNICVMDLQKTEARSDRAGEGQQPYALHGSHNCGTNICVCLFFIMRPLKLDSPESDDRIASVSDIHGLDCT
jgi:hypothetical protein